VKVRNERGRMGGGWQGCPTKPAQGSGRSFDVVVGSVPWLTPLGSDEVRRRLWTPMEPNDSIFVCRIPMPRPDMCEMPVPRDKATMKAVSQFSMFFIFEPALSSGRLCSLPGPRALLLAIGRNRPSTTRKHGPDHRWTLDLLRPNPHNAFQRRGTGHRQRLAPPHTRASSPASTHERSTIRHQSHREQNDTFKGEEQAKHKTIDTSTPLFHPAAADSTRCAWVTPKTRADKKAKPRRSWAQVQNQASTTQPGKITAGELID